MQRKNSLFIKYIFSTVLLSTLAGALSGAVIVVFKFCAGHAVNASATVYDLFAKQPLRLLVAVPALVLLAFLFTLLYRKVPDARGGGIPTSVGILRGSIAFRWLSNAVSVFFASLATFLVGVPLGTEGPSVQIGTALGRGVSRTCAKKKAALDRYIMTGGASAGFTVATGSPIAGIMFALEEAHQRFSPLLLLATTAAVVAANTVSDLLSPVFGIHASLFEVHHLASLTAAELWISITVAAVLGLGSVLFLKYFKVLNKFWTKKLAKIPAFIKILAVFLLTLIFGFASDMFVSTGHALSDMLIEKSAPIHMLLLCLAVRATLMILASGSGITGGMFLPVLALGALLSSLLGNILMALGLGGEFYGLIVMLGITAAVSGMMKMPLTAIVFAIEALSLSENILPVIITAVGAYLVTEVFAVKSITEKVLESRLHHLHEGKAARVYDCFVTVRENSFAAGKQVRDILWPADLIVLSVKREGKAEPFTDDLSETEIFVGDTLHLRYPTHDHARTREEIVALVGYQEFDEEKIEKV